MQTVTHKARLLDLIVPDEERLFIKSVKRRLGALTMSIKRRMGESLGLTYRET